MGSLIGGVLILLAPTLPFLIGGCVLIGLAALLFTRRCHYVTARSQTKTLVSISHVIGHRRFMGFAAVMIVFWILFTQLIVSLPLAALRLGHSDSAVSAVFIVKGVAGVALMFGLARLFRTRQPVPLVRWGLLSVGVGFALIAVMPALPWFLGCVALYTLGETLVLPGSDMAVAQFSGEGTSGDVGAFFGIFSLSWAIGGTIGNYLGPWLMGQGGPIWPWLIYGLLGMFGFALMLLVERIGANHSVMRSAPVVTMHLAGDE